MGIKGSELPVGRIPPEGDNLYCVLFIKIGKDWVHYGSFTESEHARTVADGLKAIGIIKKENFEIYLRLSGGYVRYRFTGVKPMPIK